MIRIRALDRKLLREIRRQRGQVISIAVVVACGIMAVVSMRGTYEALESARQSFYAETRFADVFASLVRAPNALERRLRELPGVGTTTTRIVWTATLDVPGLREPATGQLVSLNPDEGAGLNRLHLLRGRLPDPSRAEEIVASERFASANGLMLGDSIGAVIGGRWQRLRIVGLAVSPEYVFEVAPGGIFPDNRRFGIIWMPRSVLGPAIGMEGAFNQLALTLSPGASADAVMADVDRALTPYGGLGAFGREDQLSNRILDSELEQNRVSGTVIPAIFLFVAAFLLHIVLSRMVATQRDLIAVLKAFGYDNRQVGIHYMLFAMLAVFLGAALGTLLGAVTGALFVQLYAEFFRFPDLRFAVSIPTVIVGILITAAAAALGSSSAVRSAVRLPPAEAMRPEAPVRFGHGLLDRLGLTRIGSVELRMIMRNLGKRPLRTAISSLGVAMAVAILVVGNFFFDAARFMGDHQYRAVQREDITVTFDNPRPYAVRHELRQLEGVLRVEPFRVVPVRLRAAHLTEQVALTGLPADARLRRILGEGGATAHLPGGGVLLSAGLARILAVVPGDTVMVEVLEGRRVHRPLVVAGTVDELFGLNAYLEISALWTLLGEAPSVSGAWLRSADPAAPMLFDTLKLMPAVVGAESRLVMLRNFEQQLADNLLVTATIMALLASAIAIGVVYNGARISLSERGRDLASLRVLGFTRGETSYMLLGEQAVITLIGTPAGFLIGLGLAAAIVAALDTDLYRIPLVVSGSTYLYAALVVGGAAILAGFLVKRRLDRFDLVAVLKAKE